MNESQPSISLWKGQPFHFACLVALLGIVSMVWNHMGGPAPVFFWLAVSIPIFHQLFVWLAWRLELRKGLISELIGFNAFLMIFFILFIGRFLSLFLLAWIDRGTLGLELPLTLLLVLALFIPGIYAMYSVKKYFGLARASGADHFDSKYRTLPLVKEGIFRFTNNGMYLYAFLLFWALGFALNSKAALLVAAFSHVYIWVHFYATEKPDMEYIYGELA